MHEFKENLFQILSTYHRMVTCINFRPDFNLVCLCHLIYLQPGGLREGDVEVPGTQTKLHAGPNSPAVHDSTDSVTVFI
jgi:hypothetical protein